ncbi:MAG: hypothetical protein K6T17_02655 [Fimbriimonadales bacterium]|nr:hypothetical protein [Fimbriimonadales bacterium]
MSDSMERIEKTMYMLHQEDKKLLGETRAADALLSLIALVFVRHWALPAEKHADVTWGLKSIAKEVNGDARPV